VLHLEGCENPCVCGRLDCRKDEFVMNKNAVLWMRKMANVASFENAVHGFTLRESEDSLKARLLIADFIASHTSGMRNQG
jgi:hypothetical protein